MTIDGRIGLGGQMEDIVVFSYILLSSLLVMLVSWDREHRECECVAEEKSFPPLVCDRLVLLFALAFIVSFHRLSLVVLSPPLFAVQP